MDEQPKQIEYNKFDKIKLYLTGYGPFSTVKENPSEVTVNYIYEHRNKFNTTKTEIVIKQIFEVTTEYVDNNINKTLNSIKENYTDENTLHIIVSFGVASNRTVNTIETLAQNYIFDLRKNEKINSSNPNIYYSKNPVKSMVKGIQHCCKSRNDISCKFSNNAGTYLCNYIYYKTLNKCKNETNICSFFIHIPLLTTYDLTCQEEFFKNFINVLEDLYIKGNEDKRNKILSYEINNNTDEHIDAWNIKIHK
ncbi:peptidase C15, pyroglutamyl peptidase I-like protein [Anaeromyces robustus]|uniref:Peptidase C15, pyroglutamyl peptidase I-like protein n=1 Tax=Anaeromyces robustus TaxID=1754192 RepID=A0A1Y1VV96_9FUNG|nr:peptidase C15, pyroglutamyl peptidase I-like protein [Anaeromyces robustus]|eukprot:ORX64936.1 peptidase C15, pyroglutamyl peptidase I-like protein [Anaeromyces robustus]